MSSPAVVARLLKT